MNTVIELIQQPRQVIDRTIHGPTTKWNIATHVAVLTALYIIYSWILTTYQLRQMHTTIDTYTRIFIVAAGLLAPIGWIIYSVLLNILSGFRLRKPQLHHIFQVTLYIYIATLVPSIALIYLAADTGSPEVFNLINIFVYIWGLYLAVLAVIQIYKKTVFKAVLVVLGASVLNSIFLTIGAMGLLIVVDNFIPIR